MLWPKDIAACKRIKNVIYNILCKPRCPTARINAEQNVFVKHGDHMSAFLNFHMYNLNIIWQQRPMIMVNDFNKHVHLLKNAIKGRACILL